MNSPDSRDMKKPKYIIGYYIIHQHRHYIMYELLMAILCVSIKN